MFKRTKNIIKSNNVSPEIFIENNDYVNSELLTKIDLFDDYELFTITKYEHRPDLLAREIYGDVKYSWLLMYINRVSIKDLVRHKVLNIIPKPQLIDMINSTYERYYV